ncbi:hypothetical protein QR680_004689 [Steinernema hermaphroditum]|uniref:Chondroitin proteoglycan 4 domain-containing protein n=1 Tax=Steinernema hermaphroditum TaxID=289476 RepID=A0AA39HQN5_9BILA|nr:hypothetical protein QR680_004689 [Steinernema hermaphroditum]
MKTVALFVLLGLSLTYGHPVFQAQMDNIINSSPCLKKCVDAVTATNEELTVTRTVDYGHYFGNFDKICAIVDEARDCIDKCGIESNPFKLQSTTFMCQPEMREAVKEFAPCMKKEQPAVTAECTQQCGDIVALNDDLKVLQEELASSAGSSKPEKFTEFVSKTNDNCKATKCFARCSRAAFNSRCGEKAMTGEFLKAFIDRVLEATHKDLQSMNLISTLAHNVPPECDFMYTDGVMFNESDDKKAVQAIGEVIMNEQKQMVAQQSPQETEALQQTILLKQLDLLQKQEKLLEKESYKLDLEISKLKSKTNF